MIAAYKAKSDIENANSDAAISVSYAIKWKNHMIEGAEKAAAWKI